MSSTLIHATNNNYKFPLYTNSISVIIFDFAVFIVSHGILLIAYACNIIICENHNIYNNTYTIWWNGGIGRRVRLKI